MAHAVAIAAEPATEAAEQVDDHQDDQDQTKRHVALPEARDRLKKPPRRRSSKAYSRLQVFQATSAGLIAKDASRRAANVAFLASSIGSTCTPGWAQSKTPRDRA